MIPQVINTNDFLKQKEVHGAGWPLAVHLLDTKGWVSSCRQGHRGDQALSRCAPKISHAQLSCSGAACATELYLGSVGAHLDQPGHGIISSQRTILLPFMDLVVMGHEHECVKEPWSPHLG